MMGRIPLPDQKKVKDIDKKLKDAASEKASRNIKQVQQPTLTQSPMGVVQPPKRGK